MRYKWDKKAGLLNEEGIQVLQIITSHCSSKFRDMAGKELANKLNTIEQGKKSRELYENERKRRQDDGEGRGT